MLVMDTYTQNVNGLENILDLFGNYSAQLKNTSGNEYNIIKSLKELSSNMSDFYFDNAMELSENYRRVLDNVSSIENDSIRELTICAIDSMNLRYNGLEDHSSLVIADLNTIINSYKDTINLIDKPEVYMTKSQISKFQGVATSYIFYLNSIKTIVSVNEFIK